MTANRRVWIVSEVFYPEEIGTAYHMTKLAEGLGQYCSVNVLCSQPTYSARGILAPWRETRNGVDIERCPATTLNKDVVVLRLANVLTISLSLFLRALDRVRSRDVVVVVTNPPLLPFAIATACRLRGAKCVLRIDDVYPEILVATGMSSSQSIVVHLLSYLAKCLYSGVDQIVVLGRDMEQLVRRKMEHATKPIAVIPNWADVDLVVPASKTNNTLLRELGLTDKFIVQCAGNMGRAQAIETMFRAAELLGMEKDIHFLFIGSGAKRRWMESEVYDKQLNNITLLAQRPRDDQPTFLNACDIAMASLLSGMTGAGVPSRMYNIMAAGKPIIAIAEPNSELSLVTREEQIGWVVHPDSPEKLVEVILDARSNSQRLLQMGARARAVAETKYSLSCTIKAYYELLRGISDIPDSKRDAIVHS